MPITTSNSAQPSPRLPRPGDIAKYFGNSHLDLSVDADRTTVPQMLQGECALMLEVRVFNTTSTHKPVFTVLLLTKNGMTGWAGVDWDDEGKAWCLY